MELKTMIHSPEESKEVVSRLVWENLDNKLNSYLQKFSWSDVEWILDLKVEKNKHDLFIWVLQINIDWKSYRYERDDYKKLDDLINHLFDHFKEELSNK